MRSTASLARTDEVHSTIPSLRHCAPSRDFSHDYLTVCLRSARPLDEILLGRAHHRWRVFSDAGAKLSCLDRKSTRLNSSHGYISYAVFCLKTKKTNEYAQH